MSMGVILGIQFILFNFCLVLQYYFCVGLKKQAKLSTMLSSIWPHFLEEKICQKLQKCHPKGRLNIFSAKPKNAVHANQIWSRMMIIIFLLFSLDSWQPIPMWLPSFGLHTLVAKIWSSKTSRTPLQVTSQVSVSFWCIVFIRGQALDSEEGG